MGGQGKGLLSYIMTSKQGGAAWVDNLPATWPTAVCTCVPAGGQYCWRPCSAWRKSAARCDGCCRRRAAIALLPLVTHGRRPPQAAMPRAHLPCSMECTQCLGTVPPHQTVRAVFHPRRASTLTCGRWRSCWASWRPRLQWWPRRGTRCSLASRWGRGGRGAGWSPGWSPPVDGFERRTQRVWPALLALHLHV